MQKNLPAVLLRSPLQQIRAELTMTLSQRRFENLDASHWGPPKPYFRRALFQIFIQYSAEAQ